MIKVQQTEDYSLFKRMKGNRVINKKQVQKLYHSFGDNPVIASAVPITVNDKMEIIDGQHRFQALKKLRLPITYIVASKLTLAEVQVMNSATKNWRPIDYARSFKEMGNQNYAIYLDFESKYKLSHHVLLHYLTDMDRRTTTSSFRKGDFKVGDIRLAHERCKYLVEITKYYGRGDTRVFATAFRKVIEHPEYSHERMMEKVKSHGADILKDSPFMEDYMRQLEKIYNFHCGVNRVKLF